MSAALAPLECGDDVAGAEAAATALCVSCMVAVGRPRTWSVLKSVVCGPCWAAHGGKPAAGEIGPAPTETIPVAYASGQQEWLAELTGQDWVQAIRADGRRNLLAIAETVAAWAVWETLESWPTWDELMRASGVTERSVARWLLELRLRGWLELLEHGSTPETRPMPLAHLEGNRAAVYGLRLPLTSERAAAMAAELMLAELAIDLDQLPRSTATEKPGGSGGLGEGPAQADDQPEQVPVEINGTPSWSFRSLVERSGGGFSREGKPVDNSGSNTSDQGKQKMTALRAGSEEPELPDLLIMVPVSGFEMLACADELRRQRPAVLGRCSRRLVRALCRDFWRAGWCGRDILHALDHRPSMYEQLPRELGMPAELVSPRQLILGRLRAWRDDRGRVRPGYWSSRTQLTAADEAGIRELVRQRHGRAGVELLQAGIRLLWPGEQHVTAQRIREYARAAPPPQRPTPDEEGPARAGVRAAGAEEARRRAERDRRHTQLGEHARAELARLGHPSAPAVEVSPASATPPADAGAGRHAQAQARTEHAHAELARAGHADDSMPTTTNAETTSAYDRALARARADGRAARPRRRGR